MSFIKNQVLGDESPLYGRRTGLETGPFAKYIKVLTELRIVKKETAITEKPGKKQSICRG